MGCLKLTYQPTIQVLRTYELTPSREAKSVQYWLSVDPLADDAPGWTPYRYCFNNPINLIDPNGMSEGNPDWAEGTDKNGKPQIYWVDGPKDVKSGDKYLGKETSEYQEDGKRTDYKADGTIVTGTVSLPPVTIYGFRGDGAFCRGMERSMNQGYDPNWINSFNNCKIIPDYIGISISGTVIPGGGFGGAATLGYVRGDGVFGNLSLDEGFGFDVSWGVSISAGYYKGVGKPTAKSLSGVSAYQNYGSILNFTTWQDISSNNGKLRLGDYWVGGTAKVGFGSKTIFGGSVGTTLTTKPLMLW